MLHEPPTVGYVEEWHEPPPSSYLAPVVTLVSISNFLVPFTLDHSQVLWLNPIQMEALHVTFPFSMETHPMRFNCGCFLDVIEGVATHYMFHPCFCMLSLTL